MRGYVLVVVIVAGIVLAAPEAHAQARVSCPKVVAEFEETFPAIYDQAGRPAFECIRDRSAGSGSYNEAGNVIQINEVLSPEARLFGVTDKRAYWMHAVAHEVGHGWAAKNGVYPRSGEVQSLRGYSSVDASDPVTLQEDYAETFTLALGWYPDDECYAHAPYCWQLDAGHPTVKQIDALEAAGLLPSPR